MYYLVDLMWMEKKLIWKDIEMSIVSQMEKTRRKNRTHWKFKRLSQFSFDNNCVHVHMFVLLSTAHDKVVRRPTLMKTTQKSRGCKHLVPMEQKRTVKTREQAIEKIPLEYRWPNDPMNDYIFSVYVVQWKVNMWFKTRDFCCCWLLQNELYVNIRAHQPKNMQNSAQILSHNKTSKMKWNEIKTNLK